MHCILTAICNQFLYMGVRLGVYSNREGTLWQKWVDGSMFRTFQWVFGRSPHWNTPQHIDSTTVAKLQTDRIETMAIWVSGCRSCGVYQVRFRNKWFILEAWSPPMHLERMQQLHVDLRHVMAYNGSFFRRECMSRRPIMNRHRSFQYHWGYCSLELCP